MSANSPSDGCTGWNGHCRLPCYGWQPLRVHKYYFATSIMITHEGFQMVQVQILYEN